MLESLFDARLATTAHLSELHFEGRSESAKKRLGKLKAAGFIAERERRVNEPAVLSLTSRGLKALRDEGVLAKYPKVGIKSLSKRANVSEATLKHELAVMDVRVAFHIGLRTATARKIAEFSTWPRLSEFVARRPGISHREVLVQPDGFIRVEETEPDGSEVEHTFFLEVDQGTEILDTLAAKGACYLDYYRSGGFAVRNGHAPTDFQDFPFRVLMVFKTAERRNLVADALLRLIPPILTMVWLSTIEEVTKDPFGSIWICPRDYREVTRGTTFDPERHPPKDVYRRQKARENLVEKSIKRLRLFDTA